MRRWLPCSTAARCLCRVGARCILGVTKGRHRVEHINVKLFLPALNCQQRFQLSTEKKFHCGVCKKAFRLEMAAKLHLQQAHGGDGSVETGPGPGVENVPASMPSVTPLAPPNGLAERTYGDDDDRRGPRRMRPTPKPLHQPDRDVPEDAMKELLGVWDKIGIGRLEEGFVHSTMVMKVFAARPDVPEPSIYEPVTPEGDNPFENMDQTAAVSIVSESYVEERAFTEADVNGPFALAPDRTLNPFRAGKVDNPFTKMSTIYREVVKPVQQQQQKQQREEPVTAPVTPFGQLPLFGKQQERKEPITAKPVQQEVSVSGEVSSPFSAAVVNSPFIGKMILSSSSSSAENAATTPFEASPFTAASPFAVPGTQLASPFTALDATNPFAQDGSVLPAAFPTATSFSNVAVSAPQEQSPPVPEHECPTCGKKFSTFLGASMHSKAKHGIVLNCEKNDGKQKGRSVPDLPAYIPSPVDLSSTSPFGTKTAVAASWVETELIPHAQCMSNITLIGRVLDVTQERESVSHVTVFVQGEESGEEETVTLHCSGDVVNQIRGTVKRNATVFVTGTLRLHPIYEASNNKYYVSPVVHVALPTGTLAVIT